jgi:hypothetical protein
MNQSTKIEPVLENEFYHDGRGPELQRAVWKSSGTVLVGFEYFNPDDIYEETHLKNIKLVGVEAFAMASEEVHGNILANGDCKAAIFKVENSDWLRSLNPTHLSECNHYQIIFYDEIFDIICKTIEVGIGEIST